uniref:ATP-dependent DNA helicase n=1 Tax=Eptatretus burgeri TaxID=7764 RepID=A0A8C4QFY3_EPTBU
MPITSNQSLSSLLMKPPWSQQMLSKQSIMLQDITGINAPFGGKVFLMGGDFCQVLPVVPKQSQTVIVENCLKRSALWPHFKIVKLTKNMRTHENQQHYAQWLLQLGNGELHSQLTNAPPSSIEIPPQCNIVTEQDNIVDAVFTNVTDPQALSNTVILTPLNETTLTLNDSHKKLPGLPKTYTSADKAISHDENEANNYPMEFLHSITPTGMPPHRLILKPGGSASSEDQDFEPSADMMVHDFDDEQTLEEEERIEYMEREKDPTTEINNLEKEGDMPLEALLNLYGYGSNVPLPNSASEESSDTEELSQRLEASNAEKWVYHGKVVTKEDEDEEIESFSVEVPRSQHLLTRTLRSRTALEGDKGSLESESDEDYMPTDDWKKEIMVGSMYQAEVPQSLSKYGPNGKAYEGDDQLLWQPSGLSPTKVEAFLHDAARPNGTETGLAAIPLGCHLQDSEQALYKLMRCDFDTAKAREQLNSDMQAQRDDESAWTEDECRDFENGLRQFGKDFFQIQLNKVRSRSVGECVAFYYMWKKSERHDFFAQQHRLGKKKYNLHPGVTDYMDRLLDECDGIVPSLPNMECSPQAHLKPEPSPESCEPPAPSPQLPDAQLCGQTIAVTEAVQARSKPDQTPAVEELSEAVVKEVTVSR